MWHLRNTYIFIHMYLCVYVQLLLWSPHILSGSRDEFYINIASSYKMEKQPIFELFKKLKNMKHMYVSMGSKGTLGLGKWKRE